MTSNEICAMIVSSVAKSVSFSADDMIKLSDEELDDIGHGIAIIANSIISHTNWAVRDKPAPTPNPGNGRLSP